MPELDLNAIRLDIRVQRRQRERYFEMLKDASGSAALRMLAQRVKLLEEGSDDDTFRVTEFLFDVMIALALGPVSGAILGGITNKAIDAILGTRDVLLFVRKYDEGMQYAMLENKVRYTLFKNKQGKLLKTKYKTVGKTPGKLFREKVRKFTVKRTKDRTVLMWKGSADAISNSVLEVASDEARDAFDLMSSESLLSGDSNPIDLKVAVDNAAEAQKSFEVQFMDYILSTIDENTSTKEFILDIYRAIVPMGYSETEWRSHYSRYMSHFEACMWVIYLRSIEDRLVSVQQMDFLDRQGKHPEFGNKLFKSEGPTDYGSYVRIKDKKLVRYLLRNLIHPDSKEGLSIWDHFLKIKYNIRGSRAKPMNLTYDLLQEKYDIEELNGELYREMIYHHLFPYLKKIQNQVSGFI